MAYKDVDKRFSGFDGLSWPSVDSFAIVYGRRTHAGVKIPDSAIRRVGAIRERLAKAPTIVDGRVRQLPNGRIEVIPASERSTATSIASRVANELPHSLNATLPSTAPSVQLSKPSTKKPRGPQLSFEERARIERENLATARAKSIERRDRKRALAQHFDAVTNSDYLARLKAFLASG